MALHPLNGLSLCAGVAGIDLGLHLAIGPACRTVCYVEREAYPAAVLAARMGEGVLAPAPVWDDISTFDGRRWRGCVDIVSAGFPCRPWSTASRGRRVEQSLWPECLRVIREAGPSIVFCENVQREPIRRAAHDLVDLGFRVVAAPVSAAQVGAPHERRRWWLLAHSDDEGERNLREHEEVGRESETDGPRWWQRDPAGVLGVGVHDAGRVDRLRALGNGVVPLAAAHAFRTLAARTGLALMEKA